MDKKSQHKPRGARFSERSGRFRWRASRRGHRGDFVVTFIARDIFGATDNKTVTITVE